MPICGCWRRVGLLACHHVHTALSLSFVRFFSAVCERCRRRAAVGCFASCVISSSSLLPCHLVFDTG